MGRSPSWQRLRDAAIFLAATPLAVEVATGDGGGPAASASAGCVRVSYRRSVSPSRSTHHAGADGACRPDGRTGARRPAPGAPLHPRGADIAAPLRRLPSWIGITHAETSNPLSLAAYRARLSDPAWHRAGLWGPADGPTVRHGRVPLRLLLAGLGPLTLAAEFLHPGSNGGEVVGNTGSVHGGSSHVRRCFDAGDRRVVAERTPLCNMTNGLAEGSSQGVLCSSAPTRDIKSRPSVDWKPLEE
jgi:hypothetical protein